MESMFAPLRNQCLLYLLQFTLKTFRALFSLLEAIRVEENPGNEVVAKPANLLLSEVVAKLLTMSV